MAQARPIRPAPMTATLIMLFLLRFGRRWHGPGRWATACTSFGPGAGLPRSRRERDEQYGANSGAGRLAGCGARVGGLVTFAGAGRSRVFPGCVPGRG